LRDNWARDNRRNNDYCRWRQLRIKDALVAAAKPRPNPRDPRVCQREALSPSALLITAKRARHVPRNAIIFANAQLLAAAKSIYPAFVCGADYYLLEKRIKLESSSRLFD
jgi:hypothetical protein